MKLRFLGTRGEIEARTERHFRHSSLEVSYRGKTVMIDCGLDWLDVLQGLDPQPGAIAVTHAHPDHAFGLQNGAPCPVWATEDTWDRLGGYPIEDKRVVAPREPFKIFDITFEAFAVEHSIRAPAVGYRIRAGKVSIFYAPDLVYINDRDEALRGCKLYIGDGATLTRSMVRKHEDKLLGHVPVRTQLTWCQKTDVPEMIVTHCGSQIVEGDEASLQAELDELASQRGVQARFAYDGMEFSLR